MKYLYILSILVIGLVAVRSEDEDLDSGETDTSFVKVNAYGLKEGGFWDSLLHNISNEIHHFENMTQVEIKNLENRAKQTMKKFKEDVKQSIAQLEKSCSCVNTTCSCCMETLLNNTAKNPEPLCIPIPHLPFLQVCIEAYDISLQDGFHACFACAAKAFGNELLKVNLTCVNFKDGSISIDRPKSKLKSERGRRNGVSRHSRKNI